MTKPFPFYQQLDSMDCGPTCLQMIAAYYGKNYALSELRQYAATDREGVSVRGIRAAAEQIGLETMAVQMPFEATDATAASVSTVPLPFIAHWEQVHFVVVYKASQEYIWVADPKVGKQKLSRADFEKGWLNEDHTGLAVLLEPSASFYKKEVKTRPSAGFGFLVPYIQPYRQLITQIIVGLLVGSVFQLLFPFLTQALVDVGIQNQDLNFVYLILIAQLVLFFGKTSVDVIQSWILLHVGTRVNISLIADFLKKLLRLPISFFDSKHIGDLLQRVEDHQRVELFLTSATLRTIFSIFHIFVFGLVLLIYHRGIFLIFALASVLYIAWVFLFLNKRRQIDQIRFEQLASNQNALIEMIEGAQEIKLQGSAQRHRLAWAGIQAELFYTSMRSLSITQYQDTGAGFINQVKDIFISFVAARAVIQGEMTLGMLLAVQFIVGQLSAPLYQLVAFIRLAQDAKISLERLSEIHDEAEEETEDALIQTFPKASTIQIQSLSFRYNPLGNWVLKDIDLTIPEGKTTAIVGRSGSGKTTLLKLLLGFYTPEKGRILIGDTQLRQLSKRTWRAQCGAVLQDSFLFSDTIAKNISASEAGINPTRLQQALELANAQDFLQELPLGVQTKLSTKGSNLSQGQRQRLFIARTIYKNPAFVFFDEATNALDADNERVIMENLDQFFKNKTVLVVAHRLSTVKNAHQIVVLEQGEIKEIGTHADLLARQGVYYRLVKNQLEL